MEIHSLAVIFSLKAKNDIKADNTITPPETSGNCTDADTSFAATKCKKLLVYVAAPISDMIHKGLILSVVLTCRLFSSRSYKNANAKRIKPAGVHRTPLRR